MTRNILLVTAALASLVCAFLFPRFVLSRRYDLALLLVLGMLIVLQVLDV